MMKDLIPRIMSHIFTSIKMPLAALVTSGVLPMDREKVFEPLASLERNQINYLWPHR